MEQRVGGRALSLCVIGVAGYDNHGRKAAGLCLFDMMLGEDVCMATYFPDCQKIIGIDPELRDSVLRPDLDC